MQMSRKNKGAVADSMTVSREGNYRENYVESHLESVKIDSNRIHNYNNDHEIEPFNHHSRIDKREYLSSSVH